MRRIAMTAAALLLTGCAGTMSPEGLDGTQWTVVSLDGAAVGLDPPPSLVIDAEGQVSGSDGCNRFSGGLVLGASGKATVTGQGASTMMACLPDREQVARSYNSLRTAVTGWRFDGGRLILSTADGKTILLRPST